MKVKPPCATSKPLAISGVTSSSATAPPSLALITRRPTSRPLRSASSMRCTTGSMCISTQPLHDESHALPSADAEGGETERPVTCREPVRKCTDEAHTGGTERVTERDRPAVRVDTVGIGTEPFDGRHHLRSKRLVELDQID